MDAPDFLQEARQRHRQVLYNMCGHFGFLPRAMQVSASYEQSHGPLAGGGFGDVYEGVCGGRKVAVKVIRACSAGDMERKGINQASFSLFLFLDSNVLTVLNVEILQGGRNVEGPQAPKYPAAHRSDEFWAP